MLNTLIERIRRWANLRYEIERLDQLDEHLLADIGIERDQIEAFVLGRINRPDDGVLPDWAKACLSARVPQIPRRRPMVPAE